MTYAGWESELNQIWEGREVGTRQQQDGAIEDKVVWTVNLLLRSGLSTLVRAILHETYIVGGGNTALMNSKAIWQIRNFLTLRLIGSFYSRSSEGSSLPINYQNLDGFRHFIWQDARIY